MPRAGNTYQLPSSVPFNSTSNGLLTLSVDDIIGGGKDYGYVVFPEVNNLSNKVISFWATGGSTDAGTQGEGPEDSTNFVVGYMTDANDMNTFVPVDTIETKSSRLFWRDYGGGTIHNNKDWARYWVYFDNVPTDAKFFAFKAAYDRASYSYTSIRASMTKNENYIDNVTVANIGDYRMPDPDKFEVDNSAGTTVKVSWPGEGNTEWEVKVWDANNYVDYQTIDHKQGHERRLENHIMYQRCIIKRGGLNRKAFDMRKGHRFPRYHRIRTPQNSGIRIRQRCLPYHAISSAPIHTYSVKHPFFSR